MTTTVVLLAAQGALAWPVEFYNELHSRRAHPLVVDLALDDSLISMADRVLQTAPRKFALAAQCMGGFVAFEILRREPGRVERLALLNTSARSDDAQQAKRRAARLHALEAKAATRSTVDDAYVADAANWMASPASLKEIEVRQRVEVALRGVSFSTLCKQQRAIAARPDSRELVSTLYHPTLVISGLQDRMTCPTHSQELSNLMKCSRLTTYDTCGHLTALERPSAVAEELVRWLIPRSQPPS